MADHHKLSLAGHNHRLLVLWFGLQPFVKSFDDGIVTNRGQCRKKRLRSSVSASFLADGCPALD